MGKASTKRESKPDEITITNNQSRLFNLTHPEGQMVLKPGPNAVDRKLYEKHFKDHPMTQRYVDQNILTIDESGPPATAHKTPEDAVEMVKQVCDPTLLYALEAQDDRPEVRQAIDARRVEIGPTAEVEA